MNKRIIEDILAPNKRAKIEPDLENNLELEHRPYKYMCIGMYLASILLLAVSSYILIINV